MLSRLVLSILLTSLDPGQPGSGQVSHRPTPPPFDSVRVIALGPLALPEGLSDSLAIRARFEGLISTRLVAAGFTVVDSRESAAIWKRLVDSVGGFYDRVTGALVQVKYRAVLDGTLSELHAERGADAWLRPAIQVLKVDFSGGKAKWDGASDGMGRVTGGSVLALSLVVHLLDLEGNDLASGRGGLETLARDKGTELVSVPQAQLFTEEKKVNRGVQLALDPLIVALGHRTASR